MSFTRFAQMPDWRTPGHNLPERPMIRFKPHAEARSRQRFLACRREATPVYAALRLP